MVLVEIDTPPETPVKLDPSPKYVTPIPPTVAPDPTGVMRKLPIVETPDTFSCLAKSVVPVTVVIPANVDTPETLS